MILVIASITIPTTFAFGAQDLNPFHFEKSFAPSIDKLIASYNFDGDVLDNSGYGNHGTNNGASFVSGLKGQALKFDGIDDYVQIPLDINPGVMPQITITAWVNATRLEGTVISQDNGGYDRAIDIDNRGGGLGWSAFCGSGGVLGYHPVTTGDWTFLAVVYDQASAVIRLHVNDSVYQKSGSLDDGLNYLHIGANPSFGAFFKGLIDEVNIFNSALSVQETKDIYAELLPIAAAINSGQSGSSGSGLVAYYPFDNNFLDISVYSNHGIEIGNLAFSPGVAGSCVRFDGGSYIEVADSPSLDLFNAFSFSVWLNKEDAGSGGWSVILSKGDTGSMGDESPYALAHSSDGLSPLVRLVQNNKAISITSDATTGFKNWYHLTVTWDGQYVKFYIDGALVDTSTWTGYLPNSNSSLLIGCDPPGSTEYYRGYMDELRIYNYALTPAEIESIFSQGNISTPVSTPISTPASTPVTSQPTGITPAKATLTVSSAAGQTGDTVKVPLKLISAEAIGNMDITLSYDSSVLRATQVQKDPALTDVTFDSNILAGNVKIALFSSGGISGTTAIASIDFEVIGAEGASSVLTINEVIANKVSDTSPVTVQVENGLFTVTSALKGDCDGDGKVTANDALAILQAAVGKRDIRVGMDINGDGAVSSVDARMVLRAALGLENLQ